MPRIPADDLRLANLRAVVDSDLGRLSVEDLLVELLDRVRAVLDADTAAVLLLDRASNQLVARAARGLEEEVRQGIRVPVGKGFAGRIAATLRPVSIDTVGPATVANPVLWQKGVQVMLGVPLIAGGALLGVLHVGRLERRPFDGDDAELLEVVAHQVAGAVASRQLAVERAASALLERSLTPAALPCVDGLSFAARYVPAEERTVGGDWYDAFVVPSGALWVVAGDAAGHGLDAAVLMGRVRSTLRAYALEADDPAAALDLTDRKIRHFERDAMVTVLCMAARPPFDRFELASAGHPPPVLAQPGRPAELVALRPSPPIGTVEGVRREITELRLDAGAVAALYTDGLVERRGEPIDDGLERLRLALVADEPEAVATRVMNELVGATVPDDDIALLVLRRDGGPAAN
ncbi:MAG: PP2C family protein-serine/threonine phosphatase [Acidimicrobiales bacterium]